MGACLPAFYKLIKIGQAVKEATTHLNTKQPEALRLAEMLTADEWPGSVTIVSYVQECVAELLRLYARVQELDKQMTGCIRLLKRTPKITRDIYVGKDRQAWGVQAKAVLDAAIAVQTKKGEQSNG